MNFNYEHMEDDIDKVKDIYSDKITFEKCDIVIDKEKVDSVFDKFRPDVVIHCASKILDTLNKDIVWKTNFHSTKDLINISSKYKVKKFIFISTFSIFQKNYDQPIDEEEKPSFKTLYGKTKYLSEQAILNSKFDELKMGL